MVDIESLSDEQLRTKLIEHGFPIMPITGTTRKLMRKKLRILIESKNDGRRSLGRYSSEEESDGDVSSTKRSTRRATMGAPSVRSVKQTEPEVRKSTTHTTTTTTKRVQKTFQDEFDTGSDSEPEVIEVDTSFSPMSQMNFQQSTTKYSRPQTVTSSSHFSNSYSPSLADRPVLSSRFTSPTSDGALDRLNQIRSRLSLSATSYEQPPAAAEDEKAETPFLSNFTKRLSQLSTVPKPEYDYKNDIIKEHDTNGASAYIRSLQGRQSRYRDVNPSYYSSSNAGGQRNNLISVVLLAVFCLFFVCVAVMYYGMRNDGGVAVERPGKL
uniref:LEM domain-containing protein n=1 Tax=Photinus pyralis TaxID=7054 RepID=A0A1Y1LHR1_PHOPY